MTKTFFSQSVDTEAEMIELLFAGDTTSDDLASKIPEDRPCYNFFLFKHTHEGDYIESVGKCWLFRRNGKHFPCLHTVIETRVEVWENEKLKWELRAP